MSDEIQDVKHLHIERVMRTSTQEVLVVRLFDDDGSKRGIMLTKASARRLMNEIDRMFRDKVEHDVVLFHALDDEADKQPSPARRAPAGKGTMGNGPSKCKSCGAEVIWAKTANDRNCCYDVAVTPAKPRMPVYSILDGKATRCAEGVDGHHSHFSTCPNAQQHSRGGGR